MQLSIYLIQTRKLLQRRHFQTCLWKNLLQGREEISVNDELGSHVRVFLLQKQTAHSDLNRGEAKIGGKVHQLCWETDAHRPADSIRLPVDTLRLLRQRSGVAAVNNAYFERRLPADVHKEHVVPFQHVLKHLLAWKRSDSRSGRGRKPAHSA